MPSQASESLTRVSSENDLDELALGLTDQLEDDGLVDYDATCHAALLRTMSDAISYHAELFGWQVTR